MKKTFPTIAPEMQLKAKLRLKVEQYLKENLSLSQQELESEAKLAKLKPTVENNFTLLNE